jgi:phosphoenolpyruvate-protein kinase (PTS system EI component)
VGLCGQAPSDHRRRSPTCSLAEGIDSISVDPGSIIKVRTRVHDAEVRLAYERWHHHSPLLKAAAATAAAGAEHATV